MKKCLVAILAFVYLVSFTGATIHKHYCMGKLISWTLWDNSAAKSACGNCGMPKGEGQGCCNDKHIILKAKNEHKFPEINTCMLHPGAGELLPPLPSIEVPAIITVEKSYTSVPAPPGNSSLPLFLHNRVLRI